MTSTDPLNLDAIEARANAALARVRAVADGLESDAAAPGVAEIVRPALRDAARQIRAAITTDEAQQPEEQSLDVEPLARLLSAADVALHDGNYPSFDELAESGEEQYLRMARWLLKRLHVTEREAVAVPGPAEEQPCPGFLNDCPNLRPVLPTPGGYVVNIRCGCNDEQTMRRRFGAVLRTWGLLDEISDPHRAEVDAVDGLIAICKEFKVL